MAAALWLFEVCTAVLKGAPLSCNTPHKGAHPRLQVDLGSFTLHNRLEWVNGKGKQDPQVNNWVGTVHV